MGWVDPNEIVLVAVVEGGQGCASTDSDGAVEGAQFVRAVPIVGFNVCTGERCIPIGNADPAVAIEVRVRLGELEHRDHRCLHTGVSVKFWVWCSGSRAVKHRGSLWESSSVRGVAVCVHIAGLTTELGAVFGLQVFQVLHVHFCTFA